MFLMSTFADPAHLKMESANALITGKENLLTGTQT